MASRNWKSQGNRLSPRASRKEVALQTDACFQPSERPFQTPTSRMANQCVQPLCWWSFIPVVREHQLASHQHL